MNGSSAGLSFSTDRQQQNPLQSPTRIMAVGLNTSARHAADEEARAEVDVLNSRLEKTSQLTKKIRSSLSRLEATGKSVGDVIGPLHGETRKLQTLGNNIESVIASIERLRQPADSKDNEEQIVRQGPEKHGLKSYLECLARIDKALGEMRTSNIRANQKTMADLQRLVKTGVNQLENHFDKLLRGETPRSIEPLHYLTKDKPFPVLSSDKVTRLGYVNSSMSQLVLRDDASLASGPQESVLVKIYIEIRGPYMSSSLVNLGMASVNTAKKKNYDSMYKPGTNGIGTYIRGMEGLFRAEYENITQVFRRDDWGAVFQGTCQPSLAELARTLRELNAHIKAHLSTDCYLAYEIAEMVSSFAAAIEKETGELKSTLATSLKPIRETAKSSLAELLEDTRRKAANLQSLPLDGAPVPIVSETMQRLQTMVEFIRPLSGIMISLGDGGWKTRAPTSDSAPSLAGFDVSADGSILFANYCSDTIEALLQSLEQKARILLQRGGKSVMGVFLANSIIIVERMIRESALSGLMESRTSSLDGWRKKAGSLYTDSCKDVSMHLFDAIHTSRAARPTSGGGLVDSASILKGLSSKDKDKIKDKFTAFNLGFDDLVTKHKSYSMEREVRQMFAKDIQQMLEPLYNRFWDRYHEVDKGKGKYVKYDKASISNVFQSLY